MFLFIVSILFFLYDNLNWFNFAECLKKYKEIYIRIVIFFHFFLFSIRLFAHTFVNMNALLLVGGYGTRLRPLTLTTPKPLVDFCNKAILEHQILNLAKSGVNEIILAIAYKPDNIKSFVNNLQQKYNVKIFFSIENEPLGTGGPIKLAENFLSKYDDFFVFNSDIICSFPLIDMMKFHKENKSLLTIMVRLN